MLGLNDFSSVPSWTPQNGYSAWLGAGLAHGILTDEP